MKYVATSHTGGTPALFFSSSLFHRWFDNIRHFPAIEVSMDLVHRLLGRAWREQVPTWIVILKQVEFLLKLWYRNITN